MCCYLMLEIKSFVSLKNEGYFFEQGYISRGSQVLKILRRVARKKRSDRSGTFSGETGGGEGVVGTR